MKQLLNSFKSLFLGPTITVSDAQALSAAKAECQAKGWSWQEPVHIQKVRGQIWLWTNSGMRGGNVSITINGQTGEIIKSGLITY